jgi:hypothetical protein
MVPLVQFARRGIAVASRVWRKNSAAAFSAMLVAAAIFPAVARGQQAPPGTVGRVEGLDVSVDGGTAASTGNSQNGPSIFVTNGGVITVHSGQARLTLVAGGQVDICGPTKFTVLNSSDAITLALNFGRLRIQLPATTALRVFTPTIIATPLDISGGNRDITVGLELNDSLCVIAATGALQLEHQFTGEKLVVPQAGEFFLAAGKLLPVAGTPGSCRCIGMQDRPEEPRQQIPEAGLTAPPVIAEPPAPTPEDVAAGKPPVAPPPIEFSVPAHANESHPVAPAPKDAAAPAPPPVTNPVYKVVMPPLVFSADSPTPPPDPSVDMILLVRTAQVIPDWQFKGHVDAPSAGDTSKPGHASQPGPNPQKKKGGFWAAIKRIFVAPNPQE